MRVSDFFQLGNYKKDNYVIKVYDKPIPIEYCYLSKDSYMNITESEKIEDILKRIAENINKNFNEIFFLHNGERICEIVIIFHLINL